MYQINMLYTLNVYNAIYQLYLKKLRVWLAWNLLCDMAKCDFNL